MQSNHGMNIKTRVIQSNSLSFDIKTIILRAYLSHPDFHATTLKLTIMIKCGLTKTFECFGPCLDWFLSAVCKCSKNQINSPTLILLPLDPKTFPNDHAMCIGHKNNFLQK